MLSSNLAVSALGELSPGGALMHGTSQQLHRECVVLKINYHVVQYSIIEIIIEYQLV